MSALGLILFGFGLLTAWSGFDRTIVFDVLRSLLGAPVAHHDQYGSPSSDATTVSA